MEDSTSQCDTFNTANQEECEKPTIPDNAAALQILGESHNEILSRVNSLQERFYKGPAMDLAKDVTPQKTSTARAPKHLK